VEGITSLLIFAVLIAAVTMMIMTSLRITSTSMQDANAMQNSYNDALRGVGGSPASIDFSVNGVTITIGIEVTDPDDTNGFIAFAPDP
jgi:hypothetical protein